MSAIPAEKLDKLVQRLDAVQAELNSGPEQSRFVALSKEFAELSPVVATIQDLRKARAELVSTRELADASDADLAAMAREDIGPLEGRIAVAEQALKIQLLPKDAADEKSAILEVRAGTGGDEAALFAADLFRMYCRYADLQRLEDRDHLRERQRARRLQGGRSPRSPARACSRG